MDSAATDEPIVVVAPRLPAALGEDVYSAFPISPDAIENAIRLDRALAVAPSASLFRRNDSGGANPTVQGLSLRSIGPSGAGRALVTLDGVPQHDPFGGWVIWGALAPELIARANVIRGAGAGPYGAGALTGSIALEERQEHGVALGAETGSRDYSRVSGVGLAGDQHFNALLAASIEHDDGWIPVRDSRGAADTPLWRDSIAGAARVQAMVGDVLLSARLSGYAEERGSGLAGAESSVDGAAASLTFVRSPSSGAPGWRAQFWARQSDMSNAFVSVDAMRSATTPASLQYATPAFGWGANAAMRWDNLELGADIRAADGETREHFFYSGGAFTRARVAGGETLSAGAYAEAWWDFAGTLVSGGVRLDWWNASTGERTERVIATGAPILQLRPEDHSVWAPTARIGFRRTFDDTYLRGALYSGFRPPTLNELHRPFRVGNDITEANPALEPEKLYGLDAAVGGDDGPFAWSIGAFAVRLVDPITNVTLGAGPGSFPPGVFVPAGGVYRARRNAGHIDALGIEAEAHGAIGDTLSWRAALNYTDAEVTGGEAAPQLDGLRPAQAPDLSLTAGLTWRPWAGGALALDLRHEGERFEDDLNTRPLARYTGADLRLEQQVREGVNIFVALDNAFDSDIETGATATNVISYAAPRTVRFGLSAGL